MAGGEEFLKAWPAWTDELSGMTVVDVLLEWTVDTAFDQLWGSGGDFSVRPCLPPSPPRTHCAHPEICKQLLKGECLTSFPTLLPHVLQAHVREARSIKDYVEGPWVKDANLWESVGSGEQSRKTDSKHKYTDMAEYAGLSRKVTFSQATGSGLIKGTYINEEVQRCVQAEPGKGYLMHCTVGTNAPYGDRFKILLRYKLDVATIEDKPACSLRVSYCLDYIKPTNSMMKGVIGSGVDGGVKKNFAVLRELMAELVEIRDNKVEASDAPPAAMANAEPVGVESSGKGPVIWTGVLRQLNASEQRLLSAAEPAAAWVEQYFSRCQLTSSFPMPLDHHARVIVISITVTLVFMKVALGLKSMIDAPLVDYCTTDGCIPGLGQFVCFLYSASHVIDMPDNLREVVGCIVLLTLVQQVGAVVLGRLPLQGKVPIQEVASSVEGVPAGDGKVASGSETAVSEETVGNVSPVVEADEAKAASSTVVTQEMSRQLTSLKTGLKGISSTIMKSTQGMVNDVATSMQRATPPPPSVRGASSKPPTPITSPPASVLNSPPEAEKASGGDRRSAPRIPDFAEIFENERYQPLRGWGHSWPGHLMPGDCSHWSRRDGVGSSMACSDVRPSLPTGYRWSELDWSVDMSGAGEERVDEDGWAYGVHWKWINFPPAVGSGKKKFGYHFVRRRRWIRRWRPLEEHELCKDWEDDIEPDVSHREASDTSFKLNGNTIASTIASMGDILKTGTTSPLQVAQTNSPPTTSPPTTLTHSGKVSPASHSIGCPSADYQRDLAGETAREEQPHAMGDAIIDENALEATSASLVGSAASWSELGNSREDEGVEMTGERHPHRRDITPAVAERDSSDVRGEGDQLEPIAMAEREGGDTVWREEITSDDELQKSQDRAEQWTLAGGVLLDQTESHTELSSAQGQSLMDSPVAGAAGVSASLCVAETPLSDERGPGQQQSSDKLRDWAQRDECSDADMAAAMPRAGSQVAESPFFATEERKSEVAEQRAAAAAMAQFPSAGGFRADAEYSQRGGAASGQAINDGRADFLDDLSASADETDRPCKKTSGEGGPELEAKDMVDQGVDGGVYLKGQTPDTESSVSTIWGHGFGQELTAEVGGGKSCWMAGEAEEDSIAPAIAEQPDKGAAGQASDSTASWAGSGELGARMAPDADDDSKGSKRSMHSSSLTHKMSGAVDTMFKKTGAALEKTTNDMVQAVKTTELNARASMRKSTGWERPAAEDQKAHEGIEDVWHKKAVKDMKRLAGEVNTDSMNAAAQRMSAEMNVAAKKFTGEMNGAARKLTGLFGGRGNSLSGAKQTGGTREEEYEATPLGAAVKAAPPATSAGRPPRKSAKDD